MVVISHGEANLGLFQRPLIGNFPFYLSVFLIKFFSKLCLVAGKGRKVNNSVTILLIDLLLLNLILFSFIFYVFGF